MFLSGPSGAGKTTLLRLLYGALSIQRGEATVAGMTLNGLSTRALPELRRQVGVVFQDFKILPLRPVQANIALPLEVRGLSPQHIERRVRAVARALGLEGRLHVPCGELSGGEQQRVAIARAFVVNPKVLLADEPTGNLDPELSFRLVELFKQFQAYGATVIFATHSTELMRRHPSARVMRLEEGMITQANWPGARLFPSAERESDALLGQAAAGGYIDKDAAGGHVDIDADMDGDQADDTLRTQSGRASDGKSDRGSEGGPLQESPERFRRRL